MYTPRARHQNLADSVHDVTMLQLLPSHQAGPSAALTLLAADVQYIYSVVSGQTREGRSDSTRTRRVRRGMRILRIDQLNIYSSAHRTLYTNKIAIRHDREQLQRENERCPRDCRGREVGEREVEILRRARDGAGHM